MWASASLTVAGILMAANISLAATYQIDLVHSNIGFSIAHLTISTTKGNFTDYAGTVDFDPANLAASSANVIIQASSINTQDAKRDEHLKSPDFLDVQKFSAVTFKSKSIQGSGEKYTIVGDLTIHGVTKEISLPCVIRGPVASPMGTQAIGISGETIIDRKDFGIVWNKTLDTGGLAVGDEVKLLIEVEAHAK